MEWLKSLLHLWRGDFIEQERRLNRESIHEVRKAIWDTRRAMLESNEDEWLRPDRKDDGKA